tara:strand:- start:193 stop:795 length:603 start_codon:yes stop_codon:yes gene_type:complete
MKVLVGCEYSGRVREAFRKKGHDVYSCDLIESIDNSPFHIVADIRDIIKSEHWDLAIFHPPCTYLSRAGARWLYPKGKLNPERYELLLEGRELFMDCLESNIEKIAVENPTPFKIANLPKPTQIIQPFEYGDPYTKRTLLWLKNLNPLIPTNIVESVGSWLPSNTSGFRKNQKSQKGFSPNGDYSLTFNGIALGMAEQWG